MSRPRTMPRAPRQPTLAFARPRELEGPPQPRQPAASLRVAGLFAGIGGLELGLHQAGHRAEFLCEVDTGARAVLAARFAEIPLFGDIRELAELPPVDLVTAGFPCQDLSQAGQTAGIGGRQSGLVGELFRLLADARTSPRWLLLENVPFMLQLQSGRAMEFLTHWLESNGFAWAYRVVDAQGFGLPQRRHRVILLASRTEDPRGVLFADDAGIPPAIEPDQSPCGFYWTEGNRGLGWAVDAVPTLKGGSTIGIPSPPAIWMRSRVDGEIIVQPEIRDAERLQGFPAGWTEPATTAPKVRNSMRWKLVGNAVCVPVARWIGESLAEPRGHDLARDTPWRPGLPWPRAAWGAKGQRFQVGVSSWPINLAYHHLSTFLKHPTNPLSLRASAGFLDRARASRLRFVDGFLGAVAAHVERMRDPRADGSRDADAEVPARQRRVLPP